MEYTLLFGLLLGLLVWGLVAKNPIIKILARLLTASIALLSFAATVFLFNVGQKAHWTSDGPGMLLVMVGVLLCGIFTFVFGGLFFNSFSQPIPTMNPDHLLHPSAGRDEGPSPR
jgi:hypothetical protein